MGVKYQKDINKKIIEKKQVFNIKNMICFIVQIVAFGIIMALLIGCGNMPTGNIHSLSIINILSVQVSISLLSITIVQLILPDRKERIFGVTYQGILFKWKVFRCLNVLDCTIYMFLSMIINILLSFANSIIINTDIQNICNIVFIFVMFESVLLAVYMVYLGLISKFKKSRIYYLLYKRIKNGSNDVYNMLLKGMKTHPFNTKNNNMEYINVEIEILKYMLLQNKLNKHHLPKRTLLTLCTL